MKAHKNPHIAGLKPQGSCAPNTGHQWVTLTRKDGVHYFTEFNSWLILNETQTTDPAVAAILVQHYCTELGEPRLGPSMDERMERAI